MESEVWNCCRMCLNAQCLSHIFSSPEHHDKYTNVIFTITGVKVEINDNLSQQICAFCISFINESVKYRKKCEDTTMQLLSRLNNKEYTMIKTETLSTFKLDQENSTSIDISHLILDLDDDFQDYDDNISLDNLQLGKSCNVESNDNNTKSVNIEAKESLTITTVSNNHVKTEKPKVRRKVKSKNEKDMSKQERVREQVECEYCHKMLTSKLSLRNHYKIHTGFDVVCEHCGKKFITKRLLLMHCRAKHGYEKTDKCSYCDYKASNAEQVKIHERLHTGERPFACACGAAFHRRSSYLQHAASHRQDRTVQCDQCPALFKSVTLMRIHKSRHRAPTHAFQCALCDGQFARRRNVTRHVQRVHATTPAPEHVRRKML